MKKIFMLMAFALGIGTANAQLSSGEVSSKVIRTGNRAQAGNFGLYLGATSDIFKGLNSSDVTMKAMPLINLKYMATDTEEIRLGIEWWDKTEKAKSDGDVISGKGESQFMFYPGVAHHFSNKNLLDVYVGAELPIGFGHKSLRSGDDMDKETASSFNIGAGAFIGLQAYVGNLPLAVGLEYGISTIYSHVSDGQVVYDGQVVPGIDYVSKDLKSSAWRLGNQARVTVSYYFNR